MLIKIKSKNNYLLDILNKNPNTDEGLYLKPLKNGVIVGNTIDKHQYDVLFQDTKYSYLPEESNQIDFQSYCNPLVTIHICNEFFNHILKERSEYMNKKINWLNKTFLELDTESCNIEVVNFYIDSTWIRNGEFLLCKYFKNIKIEHKKGKLYKLSINGENIYETINLLSLTSLFTHITNNYGLHTYIDDGFASKYARILTNLLDTPYFVFYLFIRRTIKSERIFNEVTPIFVEYFKKKGLNIEFSFYDTHYERLKFITSSLEKDISILDIGCGEFRYYKNLMKKNFKGNYYAVDKDEQYQTLSETISGRYSEHNLFFYNDLNDFNQNDKINILITEVIEHNTYEDAIELVKTSLTKNFNKIIITTPNSDFNKYYEIDNFRHDDHKFELSTEEFHQFILNTVDITQYKYQLYNLGDSINNIQPTQVVIITKK